MTTLFMFLGLIIAALFQFQNAFKTFYFADDFYLLSISKAHDFSGFLNLFYPIKQYGFYRPFSTELFYFATQNNIFFGHLLTFTVFFLGVFFLFKLVNLLSKDKKLSWLTVFFYTLNFTHVYQLYWLAAFQEVAMFTFGIISVYLFFRKKTLFSGLFYILALLSREQALLIPVFLFFAVILKFRTKKFVTQLVFLILLALPVAIIYLINFPAVSVRPEYSVHLNFKLILNNLMWYFLWSIGFASSFPDFLTSIFSRPLPGFWRLWDQQWFTPYTILLAMHVCFCAALLRKKMLPLILFSLCGFLIFVLPITPIVHKWMLRLTIPVVFISFIYAVLLNSYKNKIVIGSFLIIYFVLNILGTKVHEVQSTFDYQSGVTLKARDIFAENYAEITSSELIYFSDPGSKDLKNIFSNQSFINYYFPKTSLKAVYAFEQEKPLGKTFILDSSRLLYR